MPNWCDNDLVISGPQRDLRRFEEEARLEDGDEVQLISAKRFVPYPKAFDANEWKCGQCGDTANVGNGQFCVKCKKCSTSERPVFMKSGYNRGGLEWCVENWGTKWDLSDVRLVEVIPSNRLSYNFLTAWNPPKPLAMAMSRRFPTLRFYLVYYEARMGFQGAFVVEAGRVLEDWMKSYCGGRGG